MGFIPQEHLQELLCKYGLTDTGKNYIVAIVKINVSQPSVPPEDIYAHFYSVRSRILSAIEDDSRLQLFRVIDLNLPEQAYIFCKTDTHILAEVFRNACMCSKEDCTSDITVAFGSVCTDIKEISKSFLHASHLITQAQYIASPVKVLIHGENGVSTATPCTVYYPLNMEQALITAVINGKQATWQALLKTLIDTNLQENTCNLMHLSLMLTATMDRILNAANVNAAAFSENQLRLYHTLQSCKTYEGLYESSLDILTKLSKELEQMTQSDSQLLRTSM